MTDLLPPEDAPGRSPRPKKEKIPPFARRVATAGFAGTFVEYYDFTLYGVLTVVFSPLFFPSDDPTTSFLAGLAVFGAGFFARPLGGIVFGHIGDRYGRRAALIGTIMLMGVSVTLMGLLPTYEQIGLWAPLLLVMARLGQGFSAGAEMLGSVTYVLESSPPSRRFLLGSLTPLGAILGGSLGGIFSGVLRGALGPDAMSSYGWRIPFLVGAPLALICLWMRARLEDSPEFTGIVARKEVVRSPLGATLRGHWRIVLIAGMVALAAHGTAGMNAYFATFLAGTRELPQDQVFIAVSMAGPFGLITIPLVGLLTDRFGRKPLLAGVLTAFAVTIVPVLWLLSTTRSFVGMAAGCVVFMSLAALIMVPALALIAEMFPPEVRYTAANFGNNIGTVLGSGLAPLAAASLAAATGSGLGPAIWIGGLVLLGLLVLPRVRTTEHRPGRATATGEADLAGT
ncbi:MFS transporter [Actinomadura rugatobispora]|uniref:MFS transporter n=1 Tax=Actinomadura rugatobispora TaxID=1994 RepID=A0ABW1A8X9_9ACTN|nr:MFS transporter [Actinomadura rugatobispora]